VNNAGFIDPHDLHQAKAQGIADVIEVNCVAPVTFTSLMLNKLKIRKSKSAIINMSSVCGGAPVKTTPLYSPTKALIRYFSLAMSLELEDKVDILVVCPGSVQTNFTLNRNRFDTCTPTQTVANALKCLGLEYKTSGWWFHEFWDEAGIFLWGINHEHVYAPSFDYSETIFGYKDYKK